MNFDKAFETLLGHEGKYSNHPSDPGGETMWGVTKRVAEANGYKGNMKDMPVDFAKAVYRKDYWDAVRADELPDVVRYAVFDGAVNSGVAQSVRWLQESVRAGVDGKIGPQTIMFTKMSEPEETLRKMLGARLQFMTDLNTFDYFGRGWSRRIASLLKGFP